MELKFNPETYSRYVDAARALIADLTRVIGENYTPTPEITQQIQTLRAVSQTVVTVIQSLHPDHLEFSQLMKATAANAAAAVSGQPTVTPPPSFPDPSPKRPMTTIPSSEPPPAPPNDGSLPRPTTQPEP